MKLIRLLLKSSWLGVAFATFTGLLSGASSAGLIATINFVLRGTELPKSLLGWSFVGLCCLLAVSTTASQALIARLAQRVVLNLQLHLTRCILACRLCHLEEIGAPRLLATLTEDVQAISNASFAVSNLCISVALIIGCFFYLSWLSLNLFCLMFVFTVLGISSQNFLIARGRKFIKLAREQQDKLFQHFQTTTEGIKELKLHHQRRQAFLVEDLQASAIIFQHQRMMATDLFSLAAGSGLLLFFIPIGLLIFVLSPLFNISFSVVSGYVLTIVFMISPLRILLTSLPIISQASVALEKIESLGLFLVAQTTEPEQANLLDYQLKWKSLTLAGVTHRYRGEREDSNFILGPINLTFYPGELVFVVGGNGSGKSTLVKLLTGLYVAETGVIEFDEQPITDANLEWYRQQFSVVFSDFYLFDRLLGLDNPHLNSQIQDYLVQLQLDHKVTVNEGVLSTTALSQGQRKRLALLTAYMENRAIYVFDEWASDQDPVFKDIFYTQLLPKLKHQGKTVFAISHDDRYFDRADRIIKLDYGKVLCDKRL
ncbi:cyclic peptide export ABC transporter [Nostoc sp. FACHB-892]|uniref:cyclic peptide export ABC transporter n=1 Tax=Nostoc sp. FACHB-892 TaxID=2692843 RepID=UPI001689C1B6|nr:cyclic peptide export ABC transporter [Nostoc sp. FACHB-892]MBD2729721.1 cyclic peptide export ABC transporter [Nostoc sp. FACHB-892]